MAVKTAPSIAEIKDWGATCDVSQAAVAIGISRSTAYELVRTNEFPCRVLTVRRRHRVVVSSLVALLTDDGAARPAQA